VGSRTKEPYHVVIPSCWVRQVNETAPPVGLGFGQLCTELLRDRLDLVEFELRGLVGQPLVVEPVTKWTG